MADAGSSIFNAKAAEKLRSPDDLDKYVRVTNPGVWVVLGACIALLAGLLAWGFFGAVSTNVSGTGACVGGRVVCYLPGELAARVDMDDTAMVNGIPFKVSSMSDVPLSRDEALATLGSDYLVSTLVTDDFAYEVEFEGPADTLNTGVPLEIVITTDRVAPISLVLG